MKTERSAGADCSCIGIGSIQNLDKLTADLHRLNELELSKINRLNKRAQGLLGEFKGLGKEYVNAILQYMHCKSKTNAQNIHRISNIIKTKVTEAHSIFPQEPIFSRRVISSVAKAEQQEAENISSIFTDLFNSFMRSNAFTSYVSHYHEIERNSATRYLRLAA